MTVLKLKPACKEYLWGGRKLIQDFHKEYEGEKLAETWELSCHPEGVSTIVNGEWSGKTLPEYLEAEGRKVLGKNCRRFQEFPILIKFIDAKDNLSIQVHPDNSYALKNESQYGKTEMWYIVDCEEDAFLYYGFAREIDKEEFKQRIEENTLPEVLNKVPVQKGDVLFIEAGTIHAIGKNIVIAEIQQNSNVTYRVYDYGRVDKEGKQRDLHIEKALAVTNRIPIIRKKSVIPHLAQCDYFTVDKLNLDGKMLSKIEGRISEDSFASLLVLDGQGTVTCGQDSVEFQKGDSLFLPAGSGKFEVQGACEALITTIGEKASPVRVAVYMSSRQIRTGLLDTDQNIIETQILELQANEAYEDTIRRIGASIKEMLDQHELRFDHCIGVGVGIPGIIDSKNGNVVYSNNIHWEKVPFVKELQKYIPLPVYMNNNTNCVASGEMMTGAASGYKNIVLLTIGNGVGGSVIINGEIFEGRMPGEIELGHMCIQMDGPMCTCGRRGCLEALVSVPALLKNTAEIMRSHPESILWERCKGDPDLLTEDIIISAAEQNDPAAEEAVRGFVSCLCTGITNLTNIFRPELFLLKGKMFVRNDYILKEVHSFISRKCFGGNQTGIPDVKAASEGEKSGLIGAAALI